MSPPRVLIVDDDAEIRRLMRRVLEGEQCVVEEEADGDVAWASILSGAPDLVVCDARMPRMDGFALVECMKSTPSTRLIPVIMVTGLDTFPDRLKAVERGADDFLVKPFRVAELVARSRSLLATKRVTDELEQASLVLKALAATVDMRDGYTGDHCARVGESSARLGAALGLDEETCRTLRLGGTLHDIGKVATPDAILLKHGVLTPEEVDVIRRHPSAGADLCAPLRTLVRVLPIIRHHHERLDGSGYPDGLSGSEIPVEVRIVAVCDIYDALASGRPYREPFPRERCLSILREEAARGWWDREVVEAFARLKPAEAGR